MNLTLAMYERMAYDATLTGYLADYDSAPAVFTTDPAPGDAQLPYIVSAGEVVQRPFDTKNSRGREVWRDIRCYTARSGSAVLVEQIAERVRSLFHRHALVVAGAETWVAEASGPVSADEEDAYGRIVTIRLVLMEV